MPSINEVIERANRARPDAIDDETKAAWLMELDGQLFRETILRHRLTPGRRARGPLEGVCPVCGGLGEDNRETADPDAEQDTQAGAAEEAADPAALYYDPVMDCCSCPACRWSELPEYPEAYPEDGDKPLLVEAPYDGLYDLYLFSKVDFCNRETENYNNSALAFNTALDDWRKQYHRTHLPIGAGGVTGLF